MKKLLIYFVSLFFAVAAYFLTFSAFYESWFPYYYEEYLSYFFLAGLAVIVLLPFAAAVSGSENSMSYFSKYISLAVIFHWTVVVLSVVVFVYMLSNGVLINGPGIYRVAP
ncbi:hypothetical protein ACJJJB_09495 [Microbulbifer sp. ANSA001]|uniref:hypothetical protein n=1 Tax=Microbulbifer sp. ANSA001 TaxID=3243358 RepID=UPI0040431430